MNLEQKLIAVIDGHYERIESKPLQKEVRDLFLSDGSGSGGTLGPLDDIMLNDDVKIVGENSEGLGKVDYSAIKEDIVTDALNKMEFPTIPTVDLNKSDIVDAQKLLSASGVEAVGVKAGEIVKVDFPVSSGGNGGTTQQIVVNENTYVIKERNNLLNDYTVTGSNKTIQLLKSYEGYDFIEVSLYTRVDVKRLVNNIFVKDLESGYISYYGSGTDFAKLTFEFIESDKFHITGASKGSVVKEYLLSIDGIKVTKPEDLINNIVIKDRELLFDGVIDTKGKSYNLTKSVEMFDYIMCQYSEHGSPSDGIYGFSLIEKNQTLCYRLGDPQVGFLMVGHFEGNIFKCDEFGKSATTITPRVIFYGISIARLSDVTNTRNVQIIANEYITDFVPGVNAEIETLKPLSDYDEIYYEKWTTYDGSIYSLDGVQQGLKEVGSRITLLRSSSNDFWYSEVIVNDDRHLTSAGRISGPRAVKWRVKGVKYSKNVMYLEETRIGTTYDEKPLFQRILTHKIPDGTAGTAYTIPGSLMPESDKVFDYDFIIKNSSGSVVKGCFVNGSATIMCYYSGDAGFMVYRGDQTDFTDITIIVRYTKR